LGLPWQKLALNLHKYLNLLVKPHQQACPNRLQLQDYSQSPFWELHCGYGAELPGDRPIPFPPQIVPLSERDRLFDPIETFAVYCGDVTTCEP
jgi:hypothetical protein